MKLTEYLCVTKIPKKTTSKNFRNIPLTMEDVAAYVWRIVSLPVTSIINMLSHRYTPSVLKKKANLGMDGTLPKTMNLEMLHIQIRCST